MRRTQAKAIERDLEKRRVLLSGPRQVGKSYLARSIAEGFQAPQYLNHDSRTEIPTGRLMCAKRSETWDSGCGMGFSRTNAAKLPLDGDSLTSAMIGIGMNFAGKAKTRANIEDTLLFASAQAMEGGDLRILAVLVTWFGVSPSCRSSL